MSDVLYILARLQVFIARRIMRNSDTKQQLNL